jgi:GAF domain/Sel1 repeat/PilZ domain
MDRSTRRLPDPIAQAPGRERRRSIRQKLNTPVYASFNIPQTGVVVDLSELLNLHEDGFAVQTSERLETHRAVTLYLDLPETKSFIHGNGQVIWSDERGRGGIRFSALPDSSRQILKEWLFTNLLVGCSNHAARNEQIALREQEELNREVVNNEQPTEPTPRFEYSHAPGDSANSSNVVRIFAEGARPASLESVRMKVAEVADDINSAFELIAEYSVRLTGASGAALAFLTDDRMICRARAGDPAPPLGAPLDVRRGLSGECVRTGLIVYCEDMENDPRVDPQVGRALGIRSVMAAPIVSDFRVIGLLEVFSPYPRAFTNANAVVLERLIEMIPKTASARPFEAKTGAAKVEAAKVEASKIADVNIGGGKIEATQIPDPEIDGAEINGAKTDDWKATESDARNMHAVREALWEHDAEVTEQLPRLVPARTESAQAAPPIDEQPTQQAPDALEEPAPAEPSRFLYRSLLGLVVSVAAIGFGYSISPIIEKHLTVTTQASQEQPASKWVSAQNAAPHKAQPQSVEELQKLADQGDADAQYQIGVRFMDRVPPDSVQAMQWFERAAESGNVAAQSALGAYYWAGRGVPQDLSKAYFWSAIALAQGDENSKQRLEGLTPQMTRTQVSDASQQAETWLRTHAQSAKSETE